MQIYYRAVIIMLRCGKAEPGHTFPKPSSTALPLYSGCLGTTFLCKLSLPAACTPRVVPRLQECSIYTLDLITILGLASQRTSGSMQSNSLLRAPDDILPRLIWWWWGGGGYLGHACGEGDDDHTNAVHEVLHPRQRLVVLPLYMSWSQPKTGWLLSPSIRYLEGTRHM